MQVDLCEIARKYIGVPFLHQGRKPEIGLDCIGLIICIAKEIGVNIIDESGYPRIPQGDYFVNKINQQLVSKNSKELEIGDVVLFNINNAPSHVGIVTKYEVELYLIHSYAPSRKVIEHRLTDDWIAKIHSIYNLSLK